MKMHRKGPGPVLGRTALLALVLGPAAALAPLPRAGPLVFHSDYTTADNRRAFLIWGALLLAALLGPLWDARGKVLRGIPAAGPDGGAGTWPPPPRLRRGLRMSLLLTPLLAFLFIGPGIAYHAIGGHELVHFGYLNEIAHGRMLNVDTRITYGPLYGYSLYLFMRLVSFTVFGFRLYWHVATVLFLAALILVSRPRFGSRDLFLVFVLYLILHTVARFYLPDRAGINGGYWGWGLLWRQGWAPVAILFLAGPLCRTRAAWPRVLAGALPVFGFFFAQESGLPGFLGLFVLVAASGNLALRRLWARDLPWMAAGALLALAAVLLPVIVRGAAPAFLEATFHWPALFLRGAGNTPFTSPTGGTAALRSYLLPAVLLLMLILEWTAVLRGTARDPAVLALLAYAALGLSSLLVRDDTAHFLNVMAAPLTAAFLFLDERLGRRTNAMDDRAGEAPPGPPRGQPRFVRPVVAAALALPLLLFRPGLADLAVGLAGRAIHFRPSPPAGLAPIELSRAGVWAPPDNWYDAHIGKRDTPEGMRMIRRLTGGSPTYIVGKKSSLAYFLADVPCAVPFTDIPSQCATDGDQALLDAALAKSKPRFLFVSEEYASDLHRSSAGTPDYRSLGLHEGFYVFQRRDLPVVDPATGPGPAGF